MKKKKQKKIRYKTFSIRLSDETKKNLIKGKKRSSVSWNKYILELLNNDKNKEV